MVRAALGVEGGVAALAAVLSWVFGLPLGENLKLSPIAVGQGIAACAPLAALMLVVAYVPLEPFQRFNQLVETSVTPLFRDCNWRQLALISALAGFGEEWFFRGVLQRGLIPYLGPLAACFTAACLFGLAHAVSTLYGLLATLIGLYLGWLWQATDNLLPPMLAHGLYDFIALIFLTRVRASRSP